MSIVDRAKRLACGCVVVVWFVAGGTPVLAAPGQTVLIDFGSDSSFRGVSVPVPDANGNYWNSVAPGVIVTGGSTVVDTTNNVTTIAMGFSTAVGTDSFNGPAGATSFPDPTPAEIAATDIDTAALGNLGVKEAAIDFAAGPGGSAPDRVRFELQGLNPSSTYSLTFFGSHKFSTDDATVYSIYSDNTYAVLVASGSLNVQQPGSPHLHNRDTVLTLANLAPQASNTLYVQFVGASGNAGYLNAMRIGELPEPASAATLLALAAPALLTRRRAVHS